MKKENLKPRRIEMIKEITERIVNKLSTHKKQLKEKTRTSRNVAKVKKIFVLF